ncbi:MAG: phosphoribosylglycinamide formyltransferase [Prevotellaceae bacterium]|nr:phosphoribosylglycinamide formyltransferase [Prevotellaceae bacterium]
MTNLAIFASGAGTNAQRLMEYFASHDSIKVRLLLTNKKDAGAIARAERMNVPVKVFGRNEFYGSNEVLDILNRYEIDLLILAGFLWLAPSNLLENFRRRIINIHPALLPKFGGRGMYGMNVHRAVINAGEKESGITIHHINSEYDKGDIIFQTTCSLDENDTPESLAEKIHALEYKYFPLIVEKLIMN